MKDFIRLDDIDWTSALVLDVLVEDLRIINSGDLEAALSRWESLRDPASLSICSNHSDEGTLLVKFDEHGVILTGILELFSNNLLKSFQFTSHNEHERTLLARHTKKLRCVYIGDAQDKIEQYIALTKIVSGLQGLGVCGVVNTAAFIIQGVSAVEWVLSPDILRSLRDPEEMLLPILGTWASVRPVEDEHGMWLYVRGYEAFGVPLLRYQTDNPSEEYADVCKWFTIIFHFFYRKDLTLEDTSGTLKLFVLSGDRQIQIVGTLTDQASLPTYFQSPFGSLIITKE